MFCFHRYRDSPQCSNSTAGKVFDLVSRSELETVFQFVLKSGAFAFGNFRCWEYAVAKAGTLVIIIIAIDSGRLGTTWSKATVERCQIPEFAKPSLSHSQRERNPKKKRELLLSSWACRLAGGRAGRGPQNRRGHRLLGCNILLKR